MRRLPNHLNAMSKYKPTQYEQKRHALKYDWSCFSQFFPVQKYGFSEVNIILSSITMHPIASYHQRVLMLDLTAEL